MAEELTLESLEGMGKADYIKAFKNKAVWKKAKAVIFMVDYKLDGKKSVIALPFKKESEMKMKMKEIKKNKTHLPKKTGGGLITVETEGPEGLKAKVELLLGGLKPETLQEKAFELFGRINATLEVLIAEGAELETESEEPGSAGNDSVKTTETVKNEVPGSASPVKPEDKTKEIKQVIAKIVKLNQSINLKDGLQETDLVNAEALKNAIKEFAGLLKTASADLRAEYGETFLKTKKIYAKLEEELKKLEAKRKAQDNKLEEELNDSLGIDEGEEENEDEDEEDESEDEAEEDEDEEDEMPASKKEALGRNKELMEELNDLMKDIKLFELV